MSLLREDLDTAAAASHALGQHPHSVIAGVIHDWTVARIQHHGPHRETQCFHALRTALATENVQHPGLMVLAASVVVHVSGGPRSDVAVFISQLTHEKRHEGTARSVPSVAVRMR
jgi:hypothetical protein